ncbi:MAG: glycosyltransferase family 4 protein [Bacteroidetes bacterium]|nr:glycosyltransferase family 4 protein [Bacteroidota bacterium]
MSRRPHICFTFVGDVTRDSRLRRFAAAAGEVADVHILQLFKSGDGHPDPRVIPFPLRSSLRQALPRFWRQASAALRELHCDLCIAADLYSLPAAARGARALGRPLVYDARELYASIAALQGRSLMQRFWTGVERRYARRATAILTVNESIAGILRDRHADVRVVRNVPDWSAPRESQKLREACGIPADRRILLSQGGLQRGRGALPLVDALAALPDCHLVFLGDGDYRGEIEAAAQLIGVSDRVSIISAVPSADLPQWTASADLGMCLIENLGRSYYLSLPNKLFEYMAAGVPVVGSDFPEIGMLLRETGAGITVDPSDGELLVRAVRVLLDDTDRYARAKAACLAASKQYHWENERRVFAALIKSLIT